MEVSGQHETRGRPGTVVVALGPGTRWLGGGLSIWKTVVSQGHTKMSSGEIKGLNV